MSQMHMIAIPDELYTYLNTLATERGETMADVLRDLVRALPPKATTLRPAPPAKAEPPQEPGPLGYDDEILVPGYDPSTDPLARFAGFFASGEPHLDQLHDAYFSGEISEDAEE